MVVVVVTVDYFDLDEVDLDLVQSHLFAHVLLVDDVVTTGSTLEACAAVLLEVEGVTVSVATIACRRSLEEFSRPAGIPIS